MQQWLTRLSWSAVLVLAAAGPCLASAPPKPAAASPSQVGTQKAAAAKRVDINSASLAELKKLPGIGDAEAARIIAARPYPSKAKLVADKVLPAATYWALEELIVAVQTPSPESKPDGQASTKP
jgi:competence protein ComEA